MKLKHLFVVLFGKITGFYNYGKNNEVLFIKNGKMSHRFFMPKGLTVSIKGNNNKIELEMPLKFDNARLIMFEDNNLISIKTTKITIKDARISASHGSDVIINKNASIGQGNFRLLANGNYKNRHGITIGENCRIGTDAIIRTSDGHSMIDPETNLATNEPQDIEIGDNVWIMSRCMLAKGTKIPNNSAVAAYTFVNKKFEEENILLAGIPAKIIRQGIKWDIRSYGNYMRDMEKEGKIS